MKLFLDTANVALIREIAAWGVLDGVTTNPSLIAREGRDFVQTIAEIGDLIRGPVSAEVIAPDTEGMVREGKLLAGISEHVVVKVPLTPAGLGATRQLADAGIRCNVTLCFQPAQAILAARAGAAYISPFVGRLDDLGQDGMQVVRDIAAIYAKNPDIKTQVLAASIRTVAHVEAAALGGAHVATIPPKVFSAMVQHKLTDAGNEAFMADWAKTGITDVAAEVARWRAGR